MDQLGQIFSGGIPNVGPGGTPPIVPGGGGGGASGGGGGLSSILPLILAGTGIFGTIGNIQANQARNSVLNQQRNYTNYLQNLTPQQVATMISQYQKPLSANLVNNVTNATQAQLAQRGLSQAPGVFAQSEAQGLAPYELQEQQLAQDALFKKLGLPISSRPSPFGPFPQTTNTSAIWQQLMQRFMGGQNGIPQSTGSANDPNLALIQSIIAGGPVGTGNFSDPGLVPQPTQPSGTGGGVD